VVVGGERFQLVERVTDDVVQVRFAGTDEPAVECDPETATPVGAENSVRSDFGELTGERLGNDRIVTGLAGERLSILREPAKTTESSPGFAPSEQPVWVSGDTEVRTPVDIV
jgi:hypothetical protein